MSNFALEPSITHGRDGFLITWMAAVHTLAVVALFHFTWPAFFLMLLLYFLTGCIGITFGFHRLLTHRSFKAKRWLERFSATCGTLALQGSPLEWVAHHRMHHAHSDGPGDPHDASQGFWYCHIGWLFYRNPDVDDLGKLKKFARDIEADPYLRWLSNPITMISLQVALGLFLWAIGGISFVLWGIFFRLALVYHVTWLVNSAAHMWGYRSHKVADLATNNWLVGLLAFGEGWHNNHHAQPSGAHVQHRWYEFDLTWQVIKTFRRMQWVWDLNLPNQEVQEARRPG